MKRIKSYFPSAIYQYIDVVKWNAKWIPNDQEWIDICFEDYTFNFQHENKYEYQCTNSLFLWSILKFTLFHIDSCIVRCQWVKTLSRTYQSSIQKHVCICGCQYAYKYFYVFELVFFGRFVSTASATTFWLRHCQFLHFRFTIESFPSSLDLSYSYSRAKGDSIGVVIDDLTSP